MEIDKNAVSKTFVDGHGFLIDLAKSFYKREINECINQ